MPARSSMSAYVGVYPYTRADGVPVARPLFQEAGGGSIPTSALHLHFDRASVGLAASLNAMWHSALPDFAVQQGKGGGMYSMCYTAEYDGCYWACAIWSSPPALNRMSVDGGSIIELRRMAICDLAPPNTASRMLGWMVRDLRRRWPIITRFISYQAVDRHAGTIYRAAGWLPLASTEFRPWNHHGGSPTQVSGTKVRWERVVR